MIDLRVPKPFNVSTRFFGLFSAKDLVRIGIPVVVFTGWQYPFNGTTLEIAGLATVFTLGLVWAKLTPYGYKIDQLLYHLARFQFNKDSTSGRVVEQENRDHVVLNDGTVVGVIEIDPVNLAARSKTEQAAVHSVYQELLETVNYPVTVHSQQKPLDLSQHIQFIENAESPRNAMKQDYIDYCRELTDSNVATTRHFIVLRVQAGDSDYLQRKFDNTDSTEVLVDELDGRCREILEKLNTGDLSSTRLIEKDLHDFIEDVDVTLPKPTARYTETSEDDSGRYRRTLYTTEYPSTLHLAWPVKVLQADAHVNITQVIKTVKPGKAVTDLEQLEEKLRAEIDSLLRHGHRGTQKLESTLEDTEWFLQTLADRRNQPVRQGIYITVTGETRSDCDQAFEKIKNRLDTNRIRYRETVLRTDQAYRTTSLLEDDILDEKQLMPTSSAATSLPFATKGVNKDSGVIYGTDYTDHTPILLDRFTWNAPHTARIGTTGSGKSYSQKLELLRTHLNNPGISIYVVDPKNEYGHLIRALGGETVKAGTQQGYGDTVAVQVPERGQRENVDLLIDAVENLYQVTSQSPGKALVVVDEAHNLMRRREGREVLAQFIREARDTDTAVTLISQNAADFTETQEGRAILDNTPAKVFTRHERVPESVTEYFQLSEREKQDLFRLKTGTDSQYSEAVLKVSNQVDTKIQVKSTPAEHALIETGEQPGHEENTDELPTTPVNDEVAVAAADGGTVHQKTGLLIETNQERGTGSENRSLLERLFGLLTGVAIAGVLSFFNFYIIPAIIELPDVIGLILQLVFLAGLMILFYWGDPE